MTATATTSTTTMDAALGYAALGYQIVPLHTVRDGRCTCGKAKCSSPGKHPHTKYGLKDASTDERIIRKWWKRWPDANVGVRTGEISGIVVVDIDSYKLDDDPLDALVAKYGELPETVEAITGGGGRHLVFRHPRGSVYVPNSSEKLGPGIDVRGDGGYIVAPPSVHRSGNVYVWEPSHHPDEMTLALLPGWLLQLVVEDKPKATGPTTDNGERQPRPTDDRGERCLAAMFAIEQTTNEKDGSKRLYKCACRCIEYDLSDAVAVAVVRAYESLRPFPRRWTNAEILQRVRDAERKVRRGLLAENDIERADPIPLAEHFIDRHHRDADGGLLLRRHRAEFYSFAGSCYQPLTDEEIDAAIYRHLEQISIVQRDSSGALKLDKLGQPKRWRIRPKSAIVREVRLALPSRGVLLGDRIDPPCWISERDDLDPTKIIACRNGLLDLETRTLHPLTPDLFSVYALPFDYDPDAADPIAWLAFLDQLWETDLEAWRALQLWFGYCLCADTRQHKILMIVGPKRSGKGTIGRVLTGLLGAVNVAAPPLASLATNFGLQPLLGKPLAIVSDARLSGRTDQAIVVERLLSISGEDLQTIDRKHKAPVTVKLPTRFMLLTNELPRLNDTSGSLPSRFVILTLTESWYGREDHDLTDKLLGELPGVLNWAIDGWVELQEQGRFTPPKSSADAIRELEDLSSPMGAFLRDCCNVAPMCSTEVGELFEAWKRWCAAQGRDRPGTKQAFSRDLRAAVPGLRTSRPRTDSGRSRFFDGVGLEDTSP